MEVPEIEAGFPSHGMPAEMSKYLRGLILGVLSRLGGQGEPGGLAGDIKTLFGPQGTLRGPADLRQALRVLLVKPGVQALLFYRFYRWLHLRGMTLLAEFLCRLNFLLTGAELDPGAEIGPGCHIWHTAGVTIGRGVKIGRNVWILHNVTLGGRGASPFNLGEEGYPRVGDNVILYTGATVLGNVEIGDGAVIGAHSLVLDSVPPGCLAYGVPARVVKRPPGRH